MRWFLAMTATLAAAALIVTGAIAKSKVHCDVMPFSFGTVPVDVSNRPNGILAEWTSTRDGVSLQCPNRVISVDVLEHASIVIDPSDPTRNTFGRAQIVIEFTGAGVTVPLKGTVRGVWDDTDIVHVINARSPGGAQIELRQMGMLDLEAETLDLDIEQGFFDIFTEWLE